MVDFMRIATRETNRGALVEIYPKFIIKRSSDLMIRGGDFYAIWVEERGLWSTDEDDAIEIIDNELRKYEQEYSKNSDKRVKVLYLRDADSGMIDTWHKYCQRQLRDNFHMLDEELIFSNVTTSKKDYASKRLSYPLEDCPTPSYDLLMSTLYSEEERHKIEWAIGSIVSGDSKKIQKFLVLYGAAGTGKSTVLNIIQQLFDGYYCVFDAKALGSSSNSFALEAFKTNPLVAIQHDGDLSKIEDNTRLNSVVSHELMTINEKFKSQYSNRFKCFLFLGTNRPVKITDAKSGLIRRLIDVTPSGNKLNPKEYKNAVKAISFELGGIATHCLNVYLSNPGAYDNYIPINMLGASNDFYNFVLDSYPIFRKEDGTSLTASWEMYKTYCDEAKVPYGFSQRIFKEELKNYFREFEDRYISEDGTVARNIFRGFRTEKFSKQNESEEEEIAHTKKNLIDFSETESIFDKVCSDCAAQYASSSGVPLKKWDKAKTKLSDLDTKELHFVKLPENHIVIDFDIPDENGEKSFEKNLEAASKFPQTYAELSKSGKGIHLHYIYTGDVEKLSSIYDDYIEVKKFTGNSSLRRKLTKCNNKPIANIGSGLPLKGEQKVINWEGVKNEKAIRTIIKRNLNKEYHNNTKPSIDYIYKTLEDAYNSGTKYDVTNLKSAVLAFAANSTNQSEYCIKLVNKMHFKSDDPSDSIDSEREIIFYDIEVFPNLFLVNWKRAGEGQKVVRMINPKPSEIEELVKYRLIGFNCRRYDNHILYARLMGYSVEELYKLSKRMIDGDDKAFFGEAYNISYTDVYDFSSDKKSLKKWEIELGISHIELGLPWDQPVPEDMWIKVAEYCDNDVIATEAVFNKCKGDWIARQILAELAGMTVNDTTNTLTTKIIFGNNRKPELVYTDLATGKASNPLYQRTDIKTAFPGYEYVNGKNMYRGTDVGKGGYVYSKPGIYYKVALLDIMSQHPHSILAMNQFGKYTKVFKDILDARIAIKHKDYEKAKTLFDGKLAKYLDDESTAKSLAQALKIAINSVYGLTAAWFDNPFRDVRNKNNIVALRGALFMRTLLDEVESRGFEVAHIKTDSIKIPNATPEIIQFVMDFGKEYGYTFEHEATYEKMCLVNDAVYIAKYPEAHEYELSTGEKIFTEWTATGTQFSIPYVFKTLFSKNEIKFDDLCETKSVSTALYLDMNEDLPDGEHNYIFVGKIGRFCPIMPNSGGGTLCRKSTNAKTGEDKYDAVSGSKGFKWLESELVKNLDKQDCIDISYYNKLADTAIETIEKFGNFEEFVS